MKTLGYEVVKITHAANATYNDPDLTKRLVTILRGVLGPANDGQ